MFDKKQCISNIYFLAKDQGKKIGDIEKQAGVSAGYISRINKDDNNTNPGIEFLSSVASELGVSIETLINYDLSELSPTQLYFVNFIERLAWQTQCYQLKWNKETVYDLKSVGVDANGDPEHPLFSIPWREDEPIYCSRFFSDEDFLGWDERCIPIDDGYNVSVGENATVYLMKILRPEYEDEDGKPAGDTIYELYLVHDKKVEPLCNSLRQCGSPYAKLLPDLYEKVKEAYDKVNIRQDVKDVIDAFMSRTDTRPKQDTAEAAARDTESPDKTQTDSTGFDAWELLDCNMDDMLPFD